MNASYHILSDLIALTSLGKEYKIVKLHLCRCFQFFDTLSSLGSNIILSTLLLWEL
jgi:hypothetical protein